MKTLFASLAALAVVTTGALAERSSDRRSSDTYFGKYSTRTSLSNHATSSNGFATFKQSAKKPSAFERMMMIESEDRSGQVRNLGQPPEPVK